MKKVKVTIGDKDAAMMPRTLRELLNLEKGDELEIEPASPGEFVFRVRHAPKPIEVFTPVVRELLAKREHQIDEGSYFETGLPARLSNTRRFGLALECGTP